MLYFRLHTGWQDSQEWIVFNFNFMHMFICIFGCDICSYSMQIWTFHISRGCCCCFVYSYIILECPMMLILDFWCYMQCTDCFLLCFCFWWYTYSLVSFRLIRFLVVFVSHWWWLFINRIRIVSLVRGSIGFVVCTWCCHNKYIV